MITSMNYLIVYPRGQQSCVRLVTDPNEIVQGPFESWALRSGQQIMFVHGQLGRMLKQFHLLGRFETGALYGFSYDDMVSILTGKLGPTDRERYLLAKAGRSAISVWDRGDVQTVVGVSRVGFAALGFCVSVIASIVKCLAIAIAIPLAVSVLKNRK